MENEPTENIFPVLEYIVDNVSYTEGCCTEEEKEQYRNALSTRFEELDERLIEELKLIYTRCIELKEDSSFEAYPLLAKDSKRDGGFGIFVVGHAGKEELIQTLVIVFEYVRADKMFPLVQKDRFYYLLS